MEYKRVSAMAVVALFALTSCAYVISASEDEGVPLIVTVPASETEPMSCAVFFADNMVYAPQWRLDNYVRIEMMVIDMTGLSSSRDIPFTATDLYPNTLYPDLPFYDGLAQQAAIMANSEEILPLTRMVSVSYMEVSITSDVLSAPIVFKAGWDPITRAKVIDDGMLGREVNKVGHVIYGMLWDTSGIEAGTYTTEVRLGRAVQVSETEWVGVLDEWYSVDYGIAHLYDPTLEGAYVTPEYPYSDLVVEGEVADFDYATYKIGEGGVVLGDYAWIELGPLIPQGSGGGNGGGGNGGDGNGNGGDGGGNGNGNVGDGGGGNGHGGKLNRAQSSVK